MIQMASKIPYMPFYPSDYLTDTQHLTTQEHGAYLLLILNYWQRGEPLEDNDRKLAGIAKMDLFDWSVVRVSLQDFFQIKDGFWYHKRVDKELAQVKATSIKAARNGKLGGIISSRNRLKSQQISAVATGSLDYRSRLAQGSSSYTDTDTDTLRIPPEEDFL
jgi:uncharacterized protein YdaU (DUF1376 family)